VSARKLLIVDVAALGWDLATRSTALGGGEGVAFHPIETVFPALTCTVQASFRTEALPCFHGVVANGFYGRHLRRAFFWEQSARLVYGRRIWEPLRGRGRRVGLLFWQQSLGESVDLVLSPRPIHKHHGGMIQDCYSQPPDLYDALSKRVGRRFNLFQYWGPTAGRGSSEWIAAATAALLRDRDRAPDLLFTYLPHLDYDLQRHGPDSPPAADAAATVGRLLAGLRAAAAETGYDWMIFGDYAMAPVTRPPVFPNRILRDAGLFRVRSVRGRAYPDFFASRAFALADHEVALVYTDDAASARAAADALARAGHVQVLDREGQRHAGVDDPANADLLLVAEEGSWCAYPWWTDDREAPDYATHVDIHNKPGYDPCELFFGFPPPRIATDAARLRGTHGRAGPGRRTAWATSLPIDREPVHITDLAKAVQDVMEDDA